MCKITQTQGRTKLFTFHNKDFVQIWAYGDNFDFCNYFLFLVILFWASFLSLFLTDYHFTSRYFIYSLIWLQFQIIVPYESLDEYLSVVDAYVDLILQNHMVCLVECVQSELLLVYCVNKRVLMPFLSFLLSALLSCPYHRVKIIEAAMHL
jgi:hypothetical protein